MSTSNHDFLAGVETEIVAEVPGFRVTHCHLAEGQRIGWCTAEHAYITFFACNDGLTLRLKNPPLRWPLRAGEIYTVPPHMEFMVLSDDGAPVSFVALQYGDLLETVAVDPPERDFSFPRSMPLPVERGPRPIGRDADLERYRHGLKRMDILAILPRLRIVVQAHGPYECVPWHTHDNVADTFLAMEGYVQVAVKDPDEIVVLAPGEIYSVPAGRPHFVAGIGGKDCTVMVLQGVGVYNYKACLDDQRGAVAELVLR